MMIKPTAMSVDDARWTHVTSCQAAGAVDEVDDNAITEGGGTGGTWCSGG